ncbi:unnamed protein product [Rhizophagus irregularis]|uniref:Uncharacterized protein n=1 Tax=Rhizophagus irregularis TaxID=588596 RepID=A0A2I1GIM4_9GLOM|nr:hypothetical protein RhiirA4_461341 [Rhizophagus irregularis]CAB4422419.1 unnamed protein product [Rhizophagus irregularis]
MSVLNRILWILIVSLILLPILSHAQEPLEYIENLPNLHYEGSDTYQDGKIIILFTQRNNEIKFINTKLYLRIVFVNRTVLPIEINYNSFSFDFIPECDVNSFDCNILFTPKALIDGYVLIESRLGSSPYREIIVSWNGIMHKKFNLRDNYQVITSLDSQKEFLITEIKNATTLGCRRFTVLNSNNSNSTINEEIETFSISKNITMYQHSSFSLTEGGFATIIFSVTKSNDLIKLTEIHIRFFKSNNDLALSKQYLLYSSISGKFLTIIGGCQNTFDGSGYTFFFSDNDGTNLSLNDYFQIHFLSSGAVTLIDNKAFDGYNPDIINYYTAEIVPLFYGGYIGYDRFKLENSSIIIFDDNINVKGILNRTFNLDVNGLKAHIIQKQSLIWFIDYNNNNYNWMINFYNLNSIDIADSRYIYQNLNIQGTFPNINENIQIPSLTSSNSLDFIINYNKPILLSNGNLTIYQYLNESIISRQSVSGISELCKLVNDTAVYIKIFFSTLHQINVKYGIRIDNDFVKTSLNEEPLFGISEGIWNFKTCKF